MNQLQFDLQVNSDNGSTDVQELKDWLTEENIKGVQVNVKPAMQTRGTMGVDADTLQLVVGIASSTGVVALVGGRCAALKAYLDRHKGKKVTMKNGDMEISFDKDTVKDADSIIKDFIEKTGGGAAK